VLDFIGGKENIVSLGFVIGLELPPIRDSTRSECFSNSNVIPLS
jgi:hypothetical protein